MLIKIFQRVAKEKKSVCNSWKRTNKQPQAIVKVFFNTGDFAGCIHTYKYAYMHLILREACLIVSKYGNKISSIFNCLFIIIIIIILQLTFFKLEATQAKGNTWLVLSQFLNKYLGRSGEQRYHFYFDKPIGHSVLQLCLKKNQYSYMFYREKKSASGEMVWRCRVVSGASSCC